MAHNIYLYLAVMAGVTFAVRVLPLTLIRGRIQNRFLQSFLFLIFSFPIKLICFT